MRLLSVAPENISLVTRVFSLGGFAKSLGSDSMIACIGFRVMASFDTQQGDLKLKSYVLLMYMVMCLG